MAACIDFVGVAISVNRASIRDMNQLLGIRLRRLLLWVSFLTVTSLNAVAELPRTSLKKMASAEFSERQQGYEELQQWSKENVKQAPDLLYQVWNQEKDPELKTRCYSLMKDAVILREFGKGKGFVGVRMEEAIVPGGANLPARRGVRIAQVVRGTPGERAGLAMGDIVTGVDDVDFSKFEQAQAPDGVVDVFSDYIQSKHPGDVINLHILRGGKKLEKKVRLMLRPDGIDRDLFGRDDEALINRSDLFFETWLKKKAEK